MYTDFCYSNRCLAAGLHLVVAVVIIIMELNYLALFLHPKRGEEGEIIILQL